MLVTQHLFANSVRIGFHRRIRANNLTKKLLRSSGIHHRDTLNITGVRDSFFSKLANKFGIKALSDSNKDQFTKPLDDMEETTELKSKRCIPCEGSVPPLSEQEIDRFSNQVPGWQVIKGEDGMHRIRLEWKVRNFKCGLQLFERIGEIAESEKHHPDLHLVSYNKIAVELHTHSIGGLTENDFIVAAKINDLEIEDLLPRKKKN
eukprot:g7599.t1